MPRFTRAQHNLRLLLAAALLVPAVASAATSHATAARAATRAASKAPGAATGWWQRLVRLVAPEGCAIDPHGACVPSPSGGAAVAPAAHTLQPILDPHGLCSPSAARSSAGLSTSGPVASAGSVAGAVEWASYVTRR